MRHFYGSSQHNGPDEIFKLLLIGEITLDDTSIRGDAEILRTTRKGQAHTEAQLYQSHFGRVVGRVCRRVFLFLSIRF